MVRGKVIDESGKPIVGGRLASLRPPRNRPRPERESENRLPRAALFRGSVAWLAKAEPRETGLTLWAYAAGHRLGTGKVVLPGGAVGCVIQLGPKTDTSFVVLDPKRQAVFRGVCRALLHRTWQAIQFPPDELLARIGDHTDAEGRAKLPAVPPDLLYQVRVTAQGFGIQFQRTIEAPGTTDPSAAGGQDRRPGRRRTSRKIARWNPADLHQQRVFERVQTTPSRPKATLMSESWMKQGRFVVPAIAVGNVRIDAVVDEKQPLRPKLPASLRVQADRETTSLEIPMVPTVVSARLCACQGYRATRSRRRIISYLLWGRMPGSRPVSDAQGNYAARVLPGSIRVQVISMPKWILWLHGNGSPFPSYQVPENVKEFDLPPIEVVPTKSISGRVVDEHDQPVGNLLISWLRAIGIMGEASPIRTANSRASLAESMGEFWFGEVSKLVI